MERPVIGILTQPHWSSNKKTPSYYIAASYVKWIESGGAIAIPIPYDAEVDLIHEIFGQINGILFPGGSAPLPDSVRDIWDLALESNRNGEYFPVWGTCLGFEYLISLTATGGEEALEIGFRSKNVSFPLIFPSEEDVINSNGIYSLQSQLYSSDALRESVSTHNITMNNHHKGIHPEKFVENEGLTSFFRITSTNLDLDGKQFVSTIESNLYPIYGVQYHPEKNNFEYGTQPGSTIPYEVISHTEEAVALSIHLATFFVNRVRRSTIGKYTLGQRHPAITTYPVGRSKDFEQVFILPPAEHWAAVGISETKEDGANNGDLLESHIGLRGHATTKI